MTPSPPAPSLPARLRAFHERLPLAGDPPNAVLSLPDDQVLYLVAILRDTPQPPPAMSPDEWQGFLDTLRPHGVYPLMAHRLRSWPAECRPPAEVMEWLNRGFLYAAARAMRAGRQIQEAVDALEAAGIEPVLLKGPALARSVYPDPALRQSCDLDLLVRPADVPAAEGVLGGLGYANPGREFSVSEHGYHHQVFTAPKNGITLELHWALDAEYDMSPADWVEEVIARRVPVAAKDLACHTLSRPDHLLFLAFHNVFVHRSLRLDWVVDTALLMAQPGGSADWEGVIGRSVAHHVRIPLELAVLSAGFWTGLSPPPGLADPSAWPGPGERERRLWPYAATRHTSVLSGFYLALQGQPGFVEKLRYGIRYVVPPAPSMAKFRRSDSPLDLPLAHLRRWARIFRYI